jgi:hypothetical protein
MRPEYFLVDDFSYDKNLINRTEEVEGFRGTFSVINHLGY